MTAKRDWDPALLADVGEHTGIRIARARKRRGLSRTDLAALANVSRSLIAKVEIGDNPATPSLIAAVAKTAPRIRRN